MTALHTGDVFFRQTAVVIRTDVEAATCSESRRLQIGRLRSCSAFRFRVAGSNSNTLAECAQTGAKAHEERGQHRSVCLSEESKTLSARRATQA